MREYDVYKWAVKGLTAEIDKLEKDIQRGKQLLRKYENGGKPKTPKTPQEIRQIIQDKKMRLKNWINSGLTLTEKYQKWNKKRGTISYG